MKNRILSALSHKEYRGIASQVKPVELEQGRVLYEAGERTDFIYFPEDATISYISSTRDGRTLEVCVVGNEGVVGIGAILGEGAWFRGVVQLPGRAYVVRRDVLRRELQRSDALRRILLQYTSALFGQIAQTAVCNKFHSVEERFCRWLLMAHDRFSGDAIPLTQEALARVLGSRRASVSVVASVFQKKGAIRYSRGVIRLLDRERLLNSSCECYETIKQRFRSNID